MSTSVAGQVGVYAGRQLSANNFLTNPATNRLAPSFYIFDGNQARDPDNTPASLLRAGLLCGKITATTGDATTPNLGSYANSVVGLTAAPYGGGQTTLTVTPQAAVEIVRRFGSTGTFNLTGEPEAGAAARTVQVTYSAVNQTTGAVTITALDAAPVAAANQVNALLTVDSTGSGTFSLTVGGITTGAITYSSTAATLVTNINTAANTAFGTGAVVASGASLAAIVLTFRGQFADSVVQPVYTTLLSGATGFTINGQGTVAVPQAAPVTTVGNPAAVTAPVYAVNSIPFVDSTGSGTFNITVEGVTTGAIKYSATTATLMQNINTALYNAFGPQIVCEGSTPASPTLATLQLVFVGPAYGPRPVGTIQATLLTGATGFTINGSGTVGTPSTCVSTTAGVSLVAWSGGSGNFVQGSLVQPQDGSQNAITIFNEEYGTDVVASYTANPSNINQPMQRFEIGGDCYANQVINLTTCSAGSEAWLKASLRSKGAVWTFDDDR